MKDMCQNSSLTIALSDRGMVRSRPQWTTDLRCVLEVSLPVFVTSTGMTVMLQWCAMILEATLMEVSPSVVICYMHHIVNTLSLHAVIVLYNLCIEWLGAALVWYSEHYGLQLIVRSLWFDSLWKNKQ